MKAHAFSDPNNPLNTYRHIFFVPARGDFRLSIPGRDTTFHDSVTDAVRVRDAVLNGKPAPGPAPLRPDFMEHERATAKVPEFNSSNTFAGRWEEQ
jgi:hypothetical protein